MSLIRRLTRSQPRSLLYSKVEHRQITCLVFDLKPDTNGPDFLRPEGTLLSDKTAFIPRHPRRIGCRLDLTGHDSPPCPTAPAAAPSFGELVIVTQQPTGPELRGNAANGSSRPFAALQDRPCERP